MSLKVDYILYDLKTITNYCRCCLKKKCLVMKVECVLEIES